MNKIHQILKLRIQNNKISNINYVRTINHMIIGLIKANNFNNKINRKLMQQIRILMKLLPKMCQMIMRTFSVLNQINRTR